MGMRSIGCVAAAMVVAVLAGGEAAHAAPGDLDATFGDAGRVTADPQGGGQTDTYGVIAPSPGGKVLQFGGTQFGSDDDFVVRFGAAVVRYRADGTLDPAFSGDGRVTVDTGRDDRLLAGAAGADGRVVAVSQTTVFAFTQSGVLDPSFSGDGIEPVGLDADGFSNDLVLRAVAVQPDGRVILAGARLTPDTDIVVMRLLRDGAPDPSFGDGGTVILGFDPPDRPPVYDGAVNVALAPGGKIVVHGGTSTYDERQVGQEHLVLARLEASGVLDPSFSGDGLVRSDESYDVPLRSLAVAPDGAILTTVMAGSYPEHEYGVLRYTPGGVRDSSFSGDGLATAHIDAGYDDDPRAVAVDPDGKVVLAGSSGATNDFEIVRFNPDGSLDRGFKTLGYDEGGSGSGNVYGVLVQPEGRIVAGGEGAGPGGTDFTLAGYQWRASQETSTSGSGGSGGAPATHRPVRCVVPHLKGLRVAKAKARLKRAHCRLGHVSRRRLAHRRHHRIARQSLRPGVKRAAGTKVRVTVAR